MSMPVSPLMLQATATPPQHNSARPLIPGTAFLTSDTSGTPYRDVTYSFSFSEDVSGFTADHITVTGGSKQRLLLRFGRHLLDRC